MPQMGESIAEGTIVRWIKKVGDSVDRDEPLFEISTDKVDAEIPSPAAGVLTEIKVKEGETVPVNSVVAVIGGRGETAVASRPTPTPSRRPGCRKRPSVSPKPAAAGRADSRHGRRAGSGEQPARTGRRRDRRPAADRRRSCGGSRRAQRRHRPDQRHRASAAGSPSTTSSASSRRSAQRRRPAPKRARRRRHRPHPGVQARRAGSRSSR